MPDPRHPLQLCSPKSRARTHSIHGNQPGLARVDPDAEMDGLPLGAGG